MPRAAAAGGAERGAQALGAIEALVDSLRHQKAQEERLLHKVQGQLRAEVGGAGELDAALAAAGARYSFLQEMRAYLRDLCACLEHKVADVEALEEARLEAMRERCEGGRAERDEVRFAHVCLLLERRPWLEPGVPSGVRCACLCNHFVRPF